MRRRAWRFARRASLPLKLALFDGRNGLIALLDPVISKPTWTSLVFDHAGLGEAMKHLFEDRWQRATEFGEPVAPDPVRWRTCASAIFSAAFVDSFAPLLRQDLAHRVDPAVLALEVSPDHQFADQPG